jgi:hypothetical protein
MPLQKFLYWEQRWDDESRHKPSNLLLALEEAHAERTAASAHDPAGQLVAHVRTADILLTAPALLD